MPCASLRSVGGVAVGFEIDVDVGQRARPPRPAPARGTGRSTSTLTVTARAARVADARPRRPPRRGRLVGGTAAARCGRIEIAAERDAVAGAADDVVLEDAHALRAGAHVDAADRAIRLLRHEQCDQRSVQTWNRVLQHQVRECGRGSRGRAQGSAGSRVGSSSGMSGSSGVGSTNGSSTSVLRSISTSSAADRNRRAGRRPCRAGAAGCSAIVQLGGVGRRGSHCVRAIMRLSWMRTSRQLSSLAALDADRDAVVGQQVEIADLDADAVDEVQDRLACASRCAAAPASASGSRGS